MADVVTIQTSRGPFTVSRAHADRFKAFLDDPDWGDYQFDPRQSGGYNPRNIAGTNTPSQHSFGNAIDINWARNARGTAGDINPDLARRLAQKHGLRWGGDWSNPDPMHFEVASGATAPPIAQRGITAFAGLGSKSAPQPPDGMDAATYGTPKSFPMMALGGPRMTPMTPYTGMTPEEVELKRRLALRQLQEGSDSSPVGHWTQALSRAIQGGLGGYGMTQAGLGERSGQQAASQALISALQGGDPKSAIAGMAGNPWTRDLARKLAAGALQGELEAQSPMGRLRMRGTELDVASKERMGPIEEEAKRETIAAAKAKRERDDALMRMLQDQEAPVSPSPVSPLPTPPIGQTPVPGISVSPPVQRSGLHDGVMPGGVTPAQFAPPQAAPAPASAPKQDDMVNTPWGRMTRERARKIGGAALLIPGKEEMGKVLLEYAKGGPDALGKEARNEVDKKELNTGEYIARLNSIKTKFDPSFQHIENRLGLKWAEWMDSFKVGQKAVSPEQRQSLAKFSQYRQEALANMNQYIKEITGAAMTDAEAKRIIAALPNPGQGLFDGDSPTVFKAKLDNALKSAQLAVVRYRYLRGNGFTGPIDQSNFSLDNMQAVIEKRGAEVEQAIRQQMPKIDPQSLQGEVAARLRKEFGLDI